MTTTRSNIEQSPLDLDALSGHTPGPWRLGAVESWCAVSGVPLRYVYRPGDDAQSRILLSGERCDADAALVAASTELLVELREQRALARTQAAELDQLRTSQKSLIEGINEAVNFIVALKPERARFSLESAIKQSEEATLASAEVGT